MWRHGVEKSGVGKFMVEGCGEMELKNPGLESSWLKTLGLKGLGLKLGFEKYEVAMSFNHGLHLKFVQYIVFSYLFIVTRIASSSKNFGSVVYLLCTTPS